MARMYIVDASLELNRKEFENYLFELITENELYDLKNLMGATKESDIKRVIAHHPYRLAKEIFGIGRVFTYLKEEP